MKLFESILERAYCTAQRIVLSEGEDQRIIQAVVRALDEKLAEPILIGNAKRIEYLLSKWGCSADRVQIIDPADSELSEEYASAYHALRASKGMDAATAAETIRTNPLAFAAMMVRQGQADATIGGAVHTSSDTMRAALQIIGRDTGVRTVSSFFLMLLDQEHHGSARALVFADCALIPQPSIDELVQIALSSAKSYEALLGDQARVAMLSFSTAGSAQHRLAKQMETATHRAREQNPDLMIDGELQFDAAFVTDVSEKKAPNSVLAGNANIMIFPSLEAGNIGYKIAQRIGCADAIGPILQGLARPANDLSRGCSVEDVYKLMAVTAVQSTAQPEISNV